jgi:hypothetical protein
MPLAVGTDSFVSLDDADAYMRKRLHSEGWPITWDPEPFAHTDLTRVPSLDPQAPQPIDTTSTEYLRRVNIKERALMLATSMLCRHSYKGCISSRTQALAFPRSGITDREGRPVASNAIPTEIAHATAELALFLILNDVTDEQTRRHTFGVRAESIGESSVTYEASSPPIGGMPWVVSDLIAPYLKTGGASAPLVH